MSLLTPAEAMDHLRIIPAATIEDTPDYADIIRKADEASDIVLDYVTHADKATWTDETCPDRVKAATKLVLSSLYDARDDTEPLSMAVKSLLRRLRDPSIA